MVDESPTYQRYRWQERAVPAWNALAGHAELEATMQPHNPVALALTPEHEARMLRLELKREEDREKEDRYSPYPELGRWAEDSPEKQRKLRALIAEKDGEAARLSSVREYVNAFVPTLASEPAVTPQAGGHFKSARRLLLPIAILVLSIVPMVLPPFEFHLPGLAYELIDREISAIGLSITLASLALGLLLKRMNDRGELGDKHGRRRHCADGDLAPVGDEQPLIIGRPPPAGIRSHPPAKPLQDYPA